MSKGKSPSAETRAKISATLSGRKLPPDVVKKVAQGLRRYYKTHPGPNLGRKMSAETHHKMSLAHMGKYPSQKTRKKRSASLKRYIQAHPGCRKHTPEAKEKISAALRRRWQQRPFPKWSEERKARFRAAWLRKKAAGFKSPKRGTHLSEETKRKISESVKRTGLPDHIRKGNSERMKTKNPMWDPAVAKRVFEQVQVKNKAEIKLEQVLEATFPGDWMYTGQGELLVAGKAPDFMNINGKKAIIELFGCFFHGCPICKKHEKYGWRPESDEKRLETFRSLSFKTLVIWEHDLKDHENVVRKIREAFYA